MPARARADVPVLYLPRPAATASAMPTNRTRSTRAAIGEVTRPALVGPPATCTSVSEARTAAATLARCDGQRIRGEGELHAVAQIGVGESVRPVVLTT